MADFLEKFFGLNKDKNSQMSQELRRIKSFDKNLTHTPKSDNYSEHLVAHGNLKRDGEKIFDIRTAIKDKGDDIEFSTNVGKVPNTTFGSAVKETLNKAFDGKFVSFSDTQSPDTSDVVYATSKPNDWLNKKRMSLELEDHAKTKELVKPVLDKSMSIGSPKRNTSYPELQEMAQELVTNEFNLQKKMVGKFSSSTYLSGGDKEKNEK